MSPGADLPSPTPGGRARPGALLLCLAVAAASCGDGPAAPRADVLELSPAGPELQFSPPGSPTPEPLTVHVRRASDLAPRQGVEVAWSVVEGEGAVLGRAVVSTDSAGLASTTLVLGPGTGRYAVRAELVQGQAGAVEFEAWAVEAPVLSRVPGGLLEPGATVTLEGGNFSPVAAHDVVLFGGVRARVLAATPSTLQVEVPRCLPPRSVPVTVSLGAVASPPRLVDIGDGGDLAPLAVGASLELDGSAPTACARLPSGGRYLALVRSAGTVAGARHRVGIRSLVAEGPSGSADFPAAGPRPAASADPIDGPGPEASDASLARPDPQGAWDRMLRLRERVLIASVSAHVGSAGTPAAPARVQAVPAMGQERRFNVLSGGDFVEVRGVARHVGEHVALYEDVETPAEVLDADDYALMAERFDDLIHPVVTSAFGRVPDLDANERVVVLLTPQVNRLTPRSSDGFIGGFFYGLDLLKGRTGSNEGEVFYTLVPDPQGLFGDPRPRNLVASSLPAILAHEFQHMIHFNERVLHLDAPGAEAVWLSEGLAQMAEDLVGREARARGDESEALLFEKGNLVRARRYLEAADETSLIIASGSGSLAERGAGWLFVRYLEEQYGGVPLLGTLTRTTGTSTGNVTAATGSAWPELLGDWGVALFDGDAPGLTDPLLANPRHRYPRLRPRRDLVGHAEAYPLGVLQLGGSDATLMFDAMPASPAHVLVEPSAGTVTLALGGADGGPTSPAAGVYLRIVRLR
ncbi:MAG: hypothetical protein KY453_08295 [Gemmatimonadetes bacterium]|nr:hypothetical protein [Gemmatimonadota bacterium]